MVRSWKTSRILLYPVFPILRFLCLFPYDFNVHKKRPAVLSRVRLRFMIFWYAALVGYTAWQFINSFVNPKVLTTVAGQMQVVRRRIAHVCLTIILLNSGYWYLLRPDAWQSVFNRLSQIDAVLRPVRYSRTHAFLTYFEISMVTLLYVSGFLLGEGAWETAKYTTTFTIVSSFTVQLMNGLVLVVRDQFVELNRRVVLTPKLEDCVAVHATLVKLMKDICKLHRVLLLVYIVELFLFITTLVYDTFKSYTVKLTLNAIALKILPIYLVEQVSHIWSIGYAGSSIKRHSSEFVVLLSQAMRSQFYPCFNDKLRLYVAVGPAVEISAFGFFSVGNHIMGHLIVTAATYFIALLQLT